MDAVSEKIVANKKVSRKTRKIKPFYDKDVGVAWGPVTLEEIKDDFKCAQAEINGRLLSKINQKSSIETDERSESQEVVNMEPIEEASVPEISAYLTASEQSKNVGNSTSSSDYLSVVESNTTFKSSEYFTTVEFEKSIINNNCGNTYLDFVTKALNSTRDGIENEYQTLVEETVNNDDKSSLDSSCILLEKSSISINEGEEMKDGYDDNLPPTDDDSVYNEELSCVVEESYENSHSTEDYSWKDEHVDEIAKCAKDIEGIETNEESCLDDSLFPRSMSPPISIPDIDLHQFDDSVDSPLNTTLDKINAILQQAEISSTHSKTDRNFECHSDNYSIANDSSKESITRTCNIVSASFLQKLSPGVKDEEPIKTVETPVKMPTNIKTTPSSSVTPNLRDVKNKQNSHIPVFKKSPGSFKVPNLPYNIREPNKLKEFKMNHLKNIVSPVRMYIKYSPQPVLKQNVNLVEKTNLKVAPKVFEPKNKENRSELPNVLYKPARKQILSADESMHLPGSIGKFVKKSAVIKHEGRQMCQRGLFLDETLDAEAELTKSFLGDCSRLSEIDSDISILHKKGALRE